MAQKVDYYEDNVEYQGGPFVVCVLGPGNDFRVEVELKGHKCPVLPQSSIYEMMKEIDFDGRTNDLKKINLVVDALNAFVKTGRIVCVDGAWIEKKEAKHASVGT
jgi:hypothetical protein